MKGLSVAHLLASTAPQADTGSDLLGPSKTSAKAAWECLVTCRTALSCSTCRIRENALIILQYYRWETEAQRAGVIPNHSVAEQSEPVLGAPTSIPLESPLILELTKQNKTKHINLSES